MSIPTNARMSRLYEAFAHGFTSEDVEVILRRAGEEALAGQEVKDVRRRVKQLLEECAEKTSQ
jgi:hypothetical protein